MVNSRMWYGRSRSSKVVDFETNRKRMCDFLLVINRQTDGQPVTRLIGRVTRFARPSVRPSVRLSFSLLRVRATTASYDWQVLATSSLNVHRTSRRRKKAAQFAARWRCWTCASKWQTAHLHGNTWRFTAYSTQGCSTKTRTGARLELTGTNHNLARILASLRSVLCTIME